MARRGRKHTGTMKGRGKAHIMSTMENPFGGKGGRKRKGKRGGRRR